MSFLRAFDDWWRANGEQWAKDIEQASFNNQTFLDMLYTDEELREQWRAYYAQMQDPSSLKTEEATSHGLHD